MNFGGVGDADIARNQFGKHELMHGSCGGVNPSQLLSLVELLRTELPAYEDFGIGNFVRQVVKIDELNELVLGKLLLETRTEPLRRVPQFKAMMNGQQDFQRKSMVLRDMNNRHPSYSPAAHPIATSVAPSSCLNFRARGPMYWLTH